MDWGEYDDFVTRMAKPERARAGTAPESSLWFSGNFDGKRQNVFPCLSPSSSVPHLVVERSHRSTLGRKAGSTQANPLPSFALSEDNPKSLTSRIGSWYQATRQRG